MPNGASNQVRRQNVLSSWARQPWFVGISLASLATSRAAWLFAPGVGPITREAPHWTVSKLNATYAYQVSGEVTPATERLVADAIATVRGTGATH